MPAVAAGQGYTYLQKCADGFLGYELALEYCTRAIKSGDLSNDSLAIAHYNRGSIMSRRRNGMDKAIGDFDEAIKLNPKPAAYVARAALKGSKRDFDGALADFDEALRLEPALAEGYLYRGQVRLKKAALQGAEEDATQALKLEPVGPIINAGSIGMYSSRPRPMDRRPHDAAALKLRGLARFDRGEFQGAVADLAGTLRYTPGDTESVLWLYLARSRAGAAAPRPDLESHARKLPAGSWGRRIAALFLDEEGPEMLFAAIAEKGVVRQAQRCQASFYTGHWRLLKGEKERAVRLFTQAKERCLAGSNELVSAEAELGRIQ